MSIILKYTFSLVVAALYIKMKSPVSPVLNGEYCHQDTEILTCSRGDCTVHGAEISGSLCDGCAVNGAESLSFLQITVLSSVLKS